MQTHNKKILIADEEGFSRVCGAILEKDGYETNAVVDLQQFNPDTDGSCTSVGLVITSVPYGIDFLEKLKNRNIPAIILLDAMNVDILLTLDQFDKTLSHCLIKPIDYRKFRTLVHQTMNRDVAHEPQ
jgi:DNA-binding NtrC family response regulator